MPVTCDISSANLYNSKQIHKNSWTVSKVITYMCVCVCVCLCVHTNSNSIKISFLTKQKKRNKNHTKCGFMFYSPRGRILVRKLTNTRQSLRTLWSALESAELPLEKVRKCLGHEAFQKTLQCCWSAWKQLPLHHKYRQFHPVSHTETCLLSCRASDIQFGKLF